MSRLSFAAFLAICIFLIQPVLATRLPVDTRKQALEIYSQGTVRLDGSIKMPDGSVLLPLLPAPGILKRAKQDGILKYPSDSDSPEIIFYPNNWGHIKTVLKGDVLTLPLPENLPEPIRKRLLSMKFPADLIVPEGLVVPRSMKAAAADLSVTLMDDSTIAKPEFGHAHKTSSNNEYHGSGIYALTSISKGSLILIDGKTFSKLAEFPTEGTPCGMDFVDGKIYVTDQAKSRVLLLDPIKRKFLGQIDLAAKSAPKGIASLPNGKLLYVSESSSSNVAVIETSSGKVLVRTKVPTGPGRLAMTEDGVYLVVLSVAAGELSVISTYNQKVIGSVKVGGVPTAVVLSTKDKIAYVSNRTSNTISVVDLSKRKILNTIKTGISPTGLALSKNRLFVVHGRDNTIGVYDCQTLAKINEIKLPLDVDFPLSICLSHDGKHLLVSSQQTDMISVFDTEKLEFIKTIPVGQPTQEIIWIPAG